MRLCANFINVPSNQGWNGEAEDPGTREAMAEQCTVGG